MMEMLVSIIIPVYNAKHYILDAIKSVMIQDYQNFEIILIDDGSTDGTDLIVKNFLNNCPLKNKIHYILQENSGVSSARNHGIRVASGDYIVFLDADDCLIQGCIRQLVSGIQKENVDAVFCNYSYFYTNVDKIKPRKMRIEQGIYTYNDLKNKLFDDGSLTGILFGSVWAAIYKKNNIIDNKVFFKNDVSVNEDGLFNIIYIKNSNRILVIDDCLYLYRNRLTNKKESGVCRDSRFDFSEPIIEKYIESFNDNVYQIQLSRRATSVGFWNAIRIKNTNVSYLKAKKYLQTIFEDEYFCLGLESLDYETMNRSKKITCTLMKKKCYFLFFLLFRYIVPFVGKINYKKESK